MKIIWNYRGHNPRLFTRGPNWWQVTIGRVAVIRHWPLQNS